jgi:hypothetical protein
MPYLHAFGRDDIFINRMITHPEYNFLYYSGSAYINSADHMGQSNPSGAISLFELNVDRDLSTYPTGLIFPFIIKDGFWLSYPSVTGSAYNELQPGHVISGSYPLTSSVYRNLISASDPASADPDNYFTVRKKILALRNSLDYYQLYSEAYRFSLAASDATPVGPFVSGTVNLIEVPSIFYDSGIKRGSVSLKFYYTGTLIDEATDSRQNGELISTMGDLSGSTIGVVLYNEGFMLLNSDTDITSSAGTTDDYLGTGTQQSAKWIYFGAYEKNGPSTPSASLYEISFKGTNSVPTMTMFATAEAGDVNNSQNPTWLSSSAANWRTSSSYHSGSYIEYDKIGVANTIQSQYCNFEDSFEKQVFIKKIGLFDKDKNLIGIAQLANPVKKKEVDDYTFKLKIDL